MKYRIRSAALKSELEIFENKGYKAINPLQLDTRYNYHYRFSPYDCQKNRKKLVLKIMRNIDWADYLKSNEKEWEAFKNNLWQSQKIPFLKNNVAKMIEVTNDPIAYVCEKVEGKTISETLWKLIHGKKLDVPDEKEYLENLEKAKEKFFKSMARCEKKLGFVPGDWYSQNCIFYEPKNIIVNVDLEGFHSYNYKSQTNDIEFLKKDWCLDV